MAKGGLVKGAGDIAMRENPTVTSKGDRHGKPYHPTPVSRPGGVAAPPPSGAKVVGHAEESGHMHPKHVRVAEGPHVVTHHHPSTLGTAMADGHRYPHPHNVKQTDRVHHSGPKHEGSGQLDSDHYVGGNRGKGPSEK